MRGVDSETEGSGASPSFQVSSTLTQGRKVGLTVDTCLSNAADDVARTAQKDGATATEVEYHSTGKIRS
jgi:hypothetical protein